jgi:hypothetical protein
MQGIAHKNLRDATLLNQFPQHRQVRAFIDAGKRRQALGGNAEAVADGEANPLFSEIERQNAASGTHLQSIGAKHAGSAFAAVQ